MVAGSASIRQDAAQTTITQSSQRAAVDWKSFDVGSQQTVRFQQPSASAVTLNRVTGPDPSQIAGRIQANGQVVLTNPSGVTFARGAQVDTAGLIVSAAGISNQNFMAGRMIFDQPAKRDAAIVNQGTLTVRQAGLAALVAPQVANTGTINARLGHVVLAGARAATLDLYGDGLVAIDVTRQVTETPRGADGKPVTSLVTNSGVVRASGGTVQLTASAVDGVVTTLVTAGGSIAAATRAGRAGTIAIGGLGGNVVVTGTLAAEGTRAGTRGGAVEVTATGSVTVASGARVLASGRAGGGTVAIGTTLARARSLGPTGATVATPAAAATTIEPGARIAADAGTSGNGGRVAILSAGRTRMDGAISARGGTSGGDGGLVEVSGHLLGITGSIDTGAPAGRPGSILLDPDLLVVVDGASGSGAFDETFLTQAGTILASLPDHGFDTISNGVINAFTGNVLLQANQVLAVLADISLTHTAHQTLTLEAGRLLTIAPNVRVTASGDVVLATGGAGPGTPPNWWSSAITVFGTVASTAGSVSLLTGPSGAIIVDAAGEVRAAQGQRLSLQADTMTLAGSLAAPNGVVEIAPASALAVEIGGTSGLALSPATLASVDTRVLRLGAVTLNGALTTTATGIRVDAPLALGDGGPSLSVSGVLWADAAGAVMPHGAGTLDLHTTGTVAVAPTGGISVGLLTGAVGALEAGQGSNHIAAIGSLAVDGALSLANAGGLTLSGPITTGGALAIADTDLIAVAGSVATGGSADLRSGGALDLDGSMSVQGGATLAAAGSVSVAGTLSAGGIEIDATGALTVPGTLRLTDAAGAMSLTGAAIGLSGQVLAGDGAVSLTAASGDVWQSGTLEAGVLRGSAAGRAVLQGDNRIATVAGFTAGVDFLLFDHGTLTVTGPIHVAQYETLGLRSDGLVLAADLLAPNGVIAIAPLAPGGTIGIDGPRAAGRLSLTQAEFDHLHAGTLTLGALGSTVTAGAITVAGSASLAAGNVPVLALATTGSVSGAGSLGAATLTGSAGAVALTGANRIGTLAGFATTGGFALANATDLTIAGPITAGGPLAITAAGAVTQIGPLVAPSVALTGSALTLLGPITAPEAVTLAATAGDLTGLGPITTASLTGSAQGAAALTGANQVATLTGFTAGGGFTFADTMDLAVTGAIAGGPTVLLSQTGMLTLTGRIGAQAVTLAADALQLGGTISAPGSLQLVSLGNVVQSGSLATGLLTITAAGSVQIGGTDTIAVLGNVAAPNGLTLRNQGDLLVQGQVVAGAAADLATTGNLTVAGPVTAAGVALAGQSVTVQGAVAASGALAVTATGGDVVVTGTLSGAPGADPLTASSADPLTVRASGNLRLSGTVSGGQVSLAAGIDLVSDGRINATALGITAGDALMLGGSTGATSATLQSGGDAVLSGTLTAGPLALTAGGNLAVTGVVAAGAWTGTAGGAVTLAGAMTADRASLSAGAGLLLSGDLQANAVTLNAGGDLFALGTLSTGLLNGRSGGSVAVTGDIRIATIGTLTAGDSLSLADGQAVEVLGLVQAGSGVSLAAQGAITVTGTVAGQTGTLGAPSIAVPGSLWFAQDLAVTATSGDVAGAGRVQAALLTGQAAGAIDLTGPNQIAALGPLRAGAGITLANQPALAIVGPVDGGPGVAITNQGSVTIGAPVTAAERIVIQSVAGGITERDTTLTAPRILLATSDAQSVWLSGGTIVTAGSVVRGRIMSDSPVLPSNGGQGALVSTGTLRQDGTLVVQPIGSPPGGSGGSVLELAASGNVSLAHVQGPGTGLVLSLQDGRATAADLTVARLDVLFDGFTGSADLAGIVGGITGAVSAQQAYILSRSNANYLLNGCAIGTVSCVTVQREQVPAQRPIDTIDFAPLRQPSDDAELLQLLPNVSRRDY